MRGERHRIVPARAPSLPPTNNRSRKVPLSTPRTERTFNCYGDSIFTPDQRVACAAPGIGQSVCARGLRNLARGTSNPAFFACIRTAIPKLLHVLSQKHALSEPGPPQASAQLPLARFHTGPCIGRTGLRSRFQEAHIRIATTSSGLRCRLTASVLTRR